MKLIWQPWPRADAGHWFRVQCHHDNGAITPTGLREADLIPVQEWCEQNKCGTRMSFDLWRFNTEAEITTFLLKWG